MATDPTRRRCLQLCAAGTGAALAGCSALASLTNDDPEDGPDDDPAKIDDWQYEPARNGDGGGGLFGIGLGGQQSGGGGANGGGGGGGVTYQGSADAAAAPESATVGLATGGAKDVGTFRRNVEEGYLPIPESMADEGLFYDYYFDVDDGSPCTDLFCPTYSPAVTPDPLSGETERYLTVGLDSGLAQDDFERPPLNLVIVLDISGSMNAAFDEYYYDRFGNRREPEGETDRQKIAVARDALVALTEQLRPADRLGVVLFNNDAHVAKPLRPVEATDMDAIRDHVQEDILANGGTNVEAGIDEATAMLEAYADADPTERENRTILLTDAQPNLGDTSTGGLRGALESNAEDNLYTTFVGIGLDFNAELVDEITTIEGSNYYSVHSADEFEERMGAEFEYMVTPLVFDLSLELDAEGYEIAQVYGSTAADEASEARTADPASGEQPRATREIMHVNTLFPSPAEEGRARGGVVLVQVEQTDASGGELTLEASWNTRAGEAQSTTRRVAFPEDGGEHFGSSAVRKAILLARYADLLREWTITERERSLESQPTPTPAPTADREAVADGGISPPPERYLGRWEQQSDPLTVSSRNEARIRTFREHFAAEAETLGDADLQQEVDLMDEILDAA